MFGKGGWIQDNQVVCILLHLLEETECILSKCLVARVIREVQADVVIDQIHRFGRTVHAVYQLGSATHSIHRESARVTEHIQYRAPS